MRSFLLATVAAATTLSACGGGGDGQQSVSGAALSGTCADLKARINVADTTITAANDVPAGTIKSGGVDVPVPAHCQLLGSMLPRVSPVDGKSYAIGFEMRLPRNWNGRYFYQANGGIDGSVVAALGPVGGGGPLNNALNMGFAVISSDAGHSSPTPFWGVDPQARLDYGYQADMKLTPVAKNIIQTAYGKGPDRSYYGGCSNGGRHSMVAASRMGDQYDGFLVGDPGFRLPLAAIANMKGAQVYNALKSDPNATDIGTGFTAAERATVSNAVLAKCDALDGVADGMVQDGAACQAAFSLDRDVPTCTGARDGSCLTAAQKTGIQGLFAGATTSTGTKIYSSFPWDNGLYTSGWALWKFSNSLQLDPGAVAFIWQVPPENPTGFDGRAFALNGNVDDMLAKVNATNSVYTESALSFMTPQNPTDLARLRNHGGKMMVYHGTADPIFSSNDTQAWYTALSGNDGARFVRYYPVPGMNHCSGGPTADQFDMLTPLVQWVESGVPPEAVVATARGPGNPGGVNTDVPASWAPNRSRPLCPFPQVAHYKRGANIEDAASFTCL